jgi:uncharacterized glyoxalase superfamily protein PhnB
MKLNRVVPMLWVENIEQTVAFYRDVLGFDCAGQLEGWACLANHEVELMISLPNQHEPFEKLGFTGSLYFQPDDVDLLWDDLKGKVPVVYPIENFTYGMREFAIRDNSGYILQFGKPIEECSAT